MLQSFNPESDNFDRQGLGKVHQLRVPALDAVSRYSKLMVLGKPGSGKTTFLQWVAIKCNLGEFQLNRVPIFIRLKNFADDTRRNDSEFRLLNYINEEFVSCGADKSVIETILTQGKGLILLDGLDEVSEENDNEVIPQIRRFIEKYFKNQYIITCRIAAQNYRFPQEKFTDVEVADFKSEQVEAFAKKWFVAVAKNDREKGEATARQFIEKLSQPENQQIRELAVTPILLNLACLVFQGKEILEKQWESKVISWADGSREALFLIIQYFKFERDYEEKIKQYYNNGSKLCYIFALLTNIPRCIGAITGLNFDFNIKEKIIQLDNLIQDYQRFQEQFKTNTQSWTQQLRAVIIESRNLGRNWQFSDQQKELLQQYYAANQLLVNCLNNSEISTEVRQEIEDNLFLPLTEKQNRH